MHHLMTLQLYAVAKNNVTKITELKEIEKKSCIYMRASKSEEILRGTCLV